MERKRKILQDLTGLELTYENDTITVMQAEKAMDNYLLANTKKVKYSKILLRITAIPFVFLMIFIAMVFHTFKRTFYFVKYGGEMITYDPKTNSKTIEDVYNSIQNNI